MKDYYQILSISKNASKEEIKKAYRTLALQWHPDKNHSTNAHERFIEIKEAYDILFDSEKRKKYDILINNVQNKTVTYNESAPFYEEYKQWKKASHKEAEHQASLKFKDFAKSIGEFVGESTNFLLTILGLGIFVWIGPYLLYTEIKEIIRDPNFFDRFTLIRWGFLALFFLIQLGITVLIILALRNLFLKLIKNDF